MQVKAIYKGGHIVPTEQDLLTQFKRGLPEGSPLVMTIEQAGKRTRPQQGLLHELLGRYARAMGESLGMVKVRCKIDMGNYIEYANMNFDDPDSLPRYRGAFVDLHAVYPALHQEGTIAFVKSEADYTKKQERELIDYVMQLCQYNDVEIRDIVETIANA